MPEAQANGVPRSVLAPAVTVVATTLWVALAIRTPTNTYHFAPIIAAASWPIVDRGGVRPTTRHSIVVAGLSTTIVLVAGLALWASDRLQGPTLWGSGTSIGETVIFAILGGIVGLIAQLRHDP